jgi:hypothetical protein
MPLFSLPHGAFRSIASGFGGVALAVGLTVAAAGVEAAPDALADVGLTGAVGLRAADAPLSTTAPSLAASAYVSMARPRFGLTPTEGPFHSVVRQSNDATEIAGGLNFKAFLNVPGWIGYDKVKPKHYDGFADVPDGYSRDYLR